MAEVFVVQSRWLRALHGIVPKDASRYSIHGVLLERKAGKLFLVATDGRRLVTINAGPDDGEDVAIILDPKDIKALGINAKMGNVIIEYFEPADSTPAGRMIYTCGALKVESQSVEGNFPDYAAVIPNGSGLGAGGPLNVNPKLLSGLLKAFGLAVGTETKVAISTYKGEVSSYNGKEALRPLRFDAQDDDVEMVGVLMPCSKE